LRFAEAHRIARLNPPVPWRDAVDLADEGTVGLARYRLHEDAAICGLQDSANRTIGTRSAAVDRRSPSARWSVKEYRRGFKRHIALAWRWTCKAYSGSVGDASMKNRRGGAAVSCRGRRSRTTLRWPP
jgi:hypothetical protein